MGFVQIGGLNIHLSRVTNIQKYSIHDGDGIRTTVFFKGCPLRCMWCHNPETQLYTSQVLHDRARCVGCEACANICPEGAIDCRGGIAYTDTEKCQQCGTCLDYCVGNLREISGIDYDEKTIVDEVMKDQMFYEESGGGVTLSGGEVMTMDMDFIESLVRQLDKKGISITIDTCGYAPYENFQRIMPYVDTVLYDLKVMDDLKHQQYVGVSNRLILENLRKLSQDGVRIYIRIPVVKEVNGNMENMKAVVSFLLENHIQVAQVNLLPYHRMGEEKYQKMGNESVGETFTTPSDEELETFRNIFIEHGFGNTKIGG